MILGPIGDKFGSRQTYGICLLLSGLSMVGTFHYYVEEIKFVVCRIPVRIITFSTCDMVFVTDYFWQSKKFYHNDGPTLCKRCGSGTFRDLTMMK